MIGDIIGAAKWIGDKIFPPDMSPEDRAKSEQILASALAERDKAKASIMVAEMSQGDNYTKRARPTVVYGGLVMIFLNYVLFPAVGRGVVLWHTFADQFSVEQLTAIADATVALPLPSHFWLAWGGIVSTWVLGRTVEKKQVGGKIGQIAELITGTQSLFGGRGNK